jgi:hypothetical protein
MGNGNFTDVVKRMAKKIIERYAAGDKEERKYLLLFLLLSVRPAESSLMHFSLPRFIVLTPLFGSPVHLQRRSTSGGVRDLYQRKEELWARNRRSNLA